MNTFVEKVFGSYKDGREAHLIEISSPNGNKAIISDYGASICSLIVSDRNSSPVDVCLGYDSLEEYMHSNGCMGGTVGRHAGRIADSKISLSGIDYPLSDNRGGYHIHGGFEGFHNKLWSYEIVGDKLVLCYVSADGEEGYPGELTAKVSYYWSDDNVLSMEYDCVSTKETVVNMNNHSYFNLSGHGSGSVLAQRLEVNSVTAAQTDDVGIFRGELMEVSGSPLDFTVSKPIGRDIDADFPPLTRVGGYDHCYILPDGFCRAAVLASDETGIEMSVFTDMPAVVLYTANFLSRRIGKSGTVYQERSGVCLETQYPANNVNLSAEIAKPVIQPGEHYRHRTDYAFRNY